MGDTSDSHHPGQQPRLGQTAPIGCETEAEALYARFSEPVCRLAERLLSDRLKSKLDGEDIAQSVFRSLFRRTANGDYEFQHTGALWRLLETMTRHRVYYWARHYQADRRNIKREIGGDSQDPGDLPGAPQATSPDGLAEELAEAVASVVSKLNERDSEIFVAWYYEHRRSVEIAERFGCSVATVNRVLARVRERIARQLHQNT